MNRVAQGPVLGVLLAYFDGKYSAGTGYGAAAALVLLSIIYSSIQHITMFLYAELGMRMRVALTTLVYQKVKKLNKFLKI